jgi:pilus assembly protein Flp/PilA
MEFDMNKFTSAVQAFLADEEGVTAIEYGLLAALIGLGLTLGATALGDGLSAAFTSIAGKVTAAIAG